MENELRDPKYFLEYLLPRPIRLAFLGASGFGCFIALVIGVAGLSAEGLQVAKEDGTLLNLGINALGLAVFAGPFHSVYIYHSSSVTTQHVQPNFAIVDAISLKQLEPSFRELQGTKE